MKRFFRKIRFSLRLLSAFWHKQKKLILLSFLIGAFTFFIAPIAYKLFILQKAQTIGYVGKFTPNDLPMDVQKLIGDGLTEVAADGRVEPKIASSWEIGDEGREYIFNLKDNFVWQDGKNLTAKDINYNFSDVTTTFLDNNKIKFELKEPFSPFPGVLARPVFKKGLVGTGEYKVKSLTKKGQVVEKILLVPTKDKSKPRMTFRFYPTEAAARTAFKLGEIDELRDIAKPEELGNWKHTVVTAEIKINRFVAIYFNNQDPVLGDKPTRQALAYAINKIWEPRAISPINPQSWFYNKSVKKYDQDLANAKTLLKNDNKEVSSFKEIELSTVPSFLSVAEEIKKDWGKLGITSKIKIITSLDDNFQALLIAHEVSSDPDQYTLWHSTQSTNISHYKSPKVDKLLEDGRKTLDPDKRKEIYNDFQRFLVEDTPAVFLFHPTLYRITRN